MGASNDQPSQGFLTKCLGMFRRKPPESTRLIDGADLIIHASLNGMDAKGLSVLANSVQALRAARLTEITNSLTKELK